MLPKKFAGILAFIIVTISIMSCGGEITQPEPIIIRPTERAFPTKTPRIEPPPPAPLPTHRPTLPPSPTNTQPPPAPSNLNLPDISDFKGTIVSTGMGGGPLCDDQYQGPPHIQGAANSFVPARTGYLCLYGLPFDEGFRVDLTAPNDSITLSGDYYATVQTFDVFSNNINLRGFGSYSNWLGGLPPGEFFIVGEAYTRIFIKIRFPADLPSGSWRFRVQTAGGMELVDDFTVAEPDSPIITVVDSRQNWITPAYSTCHYANQPQDLFAVAVGYPSNRDIYLYVYEQNDGLVFQSTAWTDERGHFYVPIRGPYRQDGKYFLIAVPEPLVGTNLPSGNMADCFYVP